MGEKLSPILFTSDLRERIAEREGILVLGLYSDRGYLGNSQDISVSIEESALVTESGNLRISGCNKSSVQNTEHGSPQ